MENININKTTAEKGENDKKVNEDFELENLILERPVLRRQSAGNFYEGRHVEAERLRVHRAYKRVEK